MPAKPQPERRKAVRKEETIRLRCTEEQKELLTAAATEAGLGLSGWLLSVALREARAARKAPGREA